MKDPKTLATTRSKLREDSALLNLSAVGKILRSRVAVRKSRRLLENIKKRSGG